MRFQPLWTIFGRKAAGKAHSPIFTSAPAACDTLEHLFEDTGTQPTDYDRILTGDLAKVGADLLVTLLRRDGIDITPVYSDCGSMLYGEDQDTHAGGSGCGCSAAVICGHILRELA